MPKGRIFAPGSGHDGIWFQHRGLPDPGPTLRETSTSTGLMLTAPYKSHTANYPPQPPKPYHDKDTGNYKNANHFSAHDNRHSFQDHGVYFGDGQDTRSLGKNITSADDRQHHTNNDYLKHYGRSVVNYNYKTEYYDTYHGERTKEAPTKRRFPKIHKEGDPNLEKLDTTTSDWYKSPDVPHKTPTHVLAVSQEPFLPSNKWKYSYHGRSQCYPSYNVNPKKYRSWLLPSLDKTEIGNVA